MNLHIRYFAVVRELLQLGEEQVTVPPNVADIGALRAWLAVRHPILAPHLGRVRFARNEVFASLGEPLEDGDVIAVIPPVAGG